MKIALLLFVLMFLNYGLNAASIRLLARNSYVGVAGIDALIAGCGFFMIGEVAHSQTWLAFLGYVVGGVTGSMLGMWLTRKP
jgi:hypothetical protein